MAREKILLVEDNPVNRRLAEFLLRSHGYQVLEAATAQEAFEIIKTNRPDLIVMDIQLPVIDGLEATKKLKEDSASRPIFRGLGTSLRRLSSSWTSRPNRPR